MKIEEIMDGIKSLAKQQGFYSRLYEQMMNMTKEEFEVVKKELEEKNFKDLVDFIIYIEEGN